MNILFVIIVYTGFSGNNDQRISFILYGTDLKKCTEAIMDRRQRKTKKAIYEAFTDLLQKESYSKISVQDIIDAADIGRTTFYAHYETKDDLLKEICTEIFSHVFSHDLMKENTHDFSNSESLRSYITHILYHLYDNRSYLSRLLSQHNENIFMDYMCQHLYELFSRNILLPESSVPQDYLLNHMVSDFAETISWWMKHQEYSPEEITDFYLITTPYLKAD